MMVVIGFEGIFAGQSEAATIRDETISVRNMIYDKPCPSGLRIWECSSTSLILPGFTLQLPLHVSPCLILTIHISRVFRLFIITKTYKEIVSLLNIIISFHQNLHAIFIKVLKIEVHQKFS